MLPFNNHQDVAASTPLTIHIRPVAILNREAASNPHFYDEMTAILHAYDPTGNDKAELQPEKQTAVLLVMRTKRAKKR